MERKGFGPRLLALLIDVVILFLFFCVVGMITGAGAMFTATTGPNGAVVVTTGARVGAIISALFGLAYGSTEIFMAGTPGKLILKMKIGSETGIVPAPQDQLVRRWLIKWSPQLLNLVWAITFFRPFSWLASLAGLVLFVGCFFALGVNRQALHDVLAHTAVYGAGVMQQGFQPIMGAGAVPPAQPPYGGPPPYPDTAPVPPAGTNVPPPPPPPPPAVG